jgi:eukaryotic-like serine/threonine-protein kinase
MASALAGPDAIEAAEPSDPAFGAPYQIVTLMARDAQGVTYLATPFGASSHVALKIVGPRDDAGAVLDRVREWKAELIQVRHPHIARLLDAGPAADSCIYVAAEYIPGPSLALPACHDGLAPAGRRAAIHQLASALETLRARGLAHMKLDAAHVKIAIGNGVHATLLGLGMSLIVDGVRPEPERDALALAALAGELGVDA